MDVPFSVPFVLLLLFPFEFSVPLFVELPLELDVPELFVDDDELPLEVCEFVPLAVLVELPFDV